jgi:hypothetical protein
LWIDGLDFISAVVTEDAVDSGHRLGEVLSPEPIDSIKTFTGMRIVKRDRLFGRVASWLKKTSPGPGLGGFEVLERLTWGLKYPFFCNGWLWDEAHPCGKDSPPKEASAAESVIGQRRFAHCQ